MRMDCLKINLAQHHHVDGGHWTIKYFSSIPNKIVKEIYPFYHYCSLALGCTRRLRGGEILKVLFLTPKIQFFIDRK